MTIFPEKISIFTPKISDDLFFSHRPGFSDFTLFTVIKCPIRPFLRKKNHYFKKYFLNKTIFYSVHPFAHIQQHYFSKYRETNAWAAPATSNLGGASPSPPRSPPLAASLDLTFHFPVRMTGIPYQTAHMSNPCVNSGPRVCILFRCRIRLYMLTKISSSVFRTYVACRQL